MLTILREIWAFISAVFERMDKIHMGLIAAGVAFYAMFAVFPGLAAIMALWSLWFDPAVVMTYLDVAHEFLPEDAADLIDAQIMSLASTGRTSVGWASFLSFMVATIAARATDWAETRPEWGLAGCAAFIAAPRATTRGLDLGGRVFLHSYDRALDPDFKVLELVLTAPVVVASWISLQYYGSTVAAPLFGGGNKLIHNVTGGIGVVEGNGGRLRAGLRLRPRRGRRRRRRERGRP